MTKTFYISFILLFAGDLHTVEADSDHRIDAPDAHGHNSKFHDSEFITNEEHMKTHHQHDFGEEVDMSKLSNEEREFLYFSSHDSDNNTSLDGLEIMQAISHGLTEANWIQIEKGEKERNGEEAVFDKERALARLVDQVLEEDDLDNNGYVTYSEFTAHRRREANVAANSAKS